MSVLDFIKTKIIYIISLVLSLLIIELYMYLYQLNIFIIVLVPFCIIISYLISFIFEYINKNRYYKEVNKVIEGLDKKYLFTEVVSSPESIEEKIYKDTFRVINANMIEEINKYKEEIKEYKDYIELWVHEVKTPIATSKLIIENNKDKVTENIGEELNKIEEYVLQALYHSKIDSANEDYIIQNIQLKTIVNNIIKSNKKSLIQNKVNIELENLDLEVKTDAKWLEFILSQILNNSIKYKKEFLNLKFIGEKDQENVLLKIVDNGIGIKKEELNKVLNRGFVGSNGRKQEASTGMGLYICKKLIEKLGHDIKITSKENVGTEVIIYFPINSYIDGIK